MVCIICMYLYIYIYIRIYVTLYVFRDHMYLQIHVTGVDTDKHPFLVTEVQVTDLDDLAEANPLPLGPVATQGRITFVFGSQENRYPA